MFANRTRKLMVLIVMLIGTGFVAACGTPETAQPAAPPENARAIEVVEAARVSDEHIQARGDSWPSRRIHSAISYGVESDRLMLFGEALPRSSSGTPGPMTPSPTPGKRSKNADSPQQHWERVGMVYIPDLGRMLLFTGMREYEKRLVGPEMWY